jgi:hypothetical protein
MDKIGNVLLAVFGGILALAIVSVIVSRKSQSPQVLQAASSALANVVAAAVNPIATADTNGNLGNNTFTTPGTVGGNPLNPLTPLLRGILP